MAALVPGDDPPAGVGQQRGEHVERAGEVEAAVEERQRGRVGAAPLVDGNADAVGVDVAHPVGRARARMVDVLDLLLCGHLRHRSSSN